MDIFKALFEAKGIPPSESNNSNENKIHFSFQEQKKIFIQGPANSGRTSLLFEVAIHYAEHGLSVIFISPKKIAKLPLFLANRQKPNNVLLNKIQMVYLGSKNEFLEFMASVHIRYKDRKSLLIVDDIDYFFQDCPKSTELALVAKTFAFLLDACSFLGKLNNPGPGLCSPCSIVCSAAVATESNTLKSLYSHWFSDCYHIQHAKEKDSFTIHLQKNADNRDLELPIVSFMIKEGRIYMIKG